MSKLLQASVCPINQTVIFKLICSFFVLFKVSKQRPVHQRFWWAVENGSYRGTTFRIWWVLRDYSPTIVDNKYAQITDEDCRCSPLSQTEAWCLQVLEQLPHTHLLLEDFTPDTDLISQQQLEQMEELFSTFGIRPDKLNQKTSVQLVLIGAVCPKRAAHRVNTCMCRSVLEPMILKESGKQNFMSFLLSSCSKMFKWHFHFVQMSH